MPIIERLQQDRLLSTAMPIERLQQDGFFSDENPIAGLR
jgi:hypothetical protein